MEELKKNINLIHTTNLGIERIKRNLNNNCDVVEFCKDIIKNQNCEIIKKGKNFYCKYENVIITINSYSFTIITAHLI